MLMGRLDSWKIVWVMFGFFYQTRFWNGKRFGYKIWTLITQGGSPKYPLYSFDQNGKSPLLFLFASGFGATLFRADPFKLQGNGEKVAFFFQCSKQPSLDEVHQTQHSVAKPSSMLEFCFWIPDDFRSIVPVIAGTCWDFLIFCQWAVSVTAGWCCHEIIMWVSCKF